MLDGISSFDPELAEADSGSNDVRVGATAVYLSIDA